MLCVEPAGAAAGRLGENDAPRTSISSFHARSLLLVACLTDSLEGDLRVSSLHVEIPSDGPCPFRSASEKASCSALHAHRFMIKNHSWSRPTSGL